MHTRPPFLLFTDLDGTLLDHRTYSADAAMPALEWLKQQAIPLIFCSSKTPEEQVCLQEKLGIRQPFIFENGGGAGIPVEMPAMEDNLLIEPLGAYRLYDFSSVTAAEIRHFLKEIAIKTGLKLPVFDDLTPEEMQMVTGLPPEAHARASARRCSMTIARTLDEDSIRQLTPLCRERGLVLSRGGRFYTVTDEKVDKGAAVSRIIRYLRQIYGQHIPTAAIGDSHNDLPMLQVVDCPFLLQNTSGGWADPDLPLVECLPLQNGAGFCAAVDRMKKQGKIQ